MTGDVGLVLTRVFALIVQQPNDTATGGAVVVQKLVNQAKIPERYAALLAAYCSSCYFETCLNPSDRFRHPRLEYRGRAHALKIAQGGGGGSPAWVAEAKTQV